MCKAMASNLKSSSVKDPEDWLKQKGGGGGGEVTVAQAHQRKLDLISTGLDIDPDELT